MTEAKSSFSTLEHFTPAFSMKLASQPQGVIEGYASTFGGEADTYGDVIAPGAFAKSLAEHRARQSAPAMLWAHDPASPIGRWTNFIEDGTGLKVSGKLTLGVPRAVEALALAKDGALAFSIGFRARDFERTPSGKRLLKQIELGEVSLVSMPANPSARITAVKSAEEIKEPREFENFLREAGFSRARQGDHRRRLQGRRPSAGHRRRRK